MNSFHEFVCLNVTQQVRQQVQLKRMNALKSKHISASLVLLPSLAHCLWKYMKQFFSAMKHKSVADFEHCTFTIPLQPRYLHRPRSPPKQANDQCYPDTQELMALVQHDLCISSQPGLPQHSVMVSPSSSRLSSPCKGNLQC